MSYTDMDIAWDIHQEELARQELQELFEHTVDEFKRDRLSSHYRDNPDMHHSMRRILTQAQELHKAGFYSPSLVFSVACVECTIRDLLVRPFVIGLIHSETFAELVTDTVLAHTCQEKYKHLLFRIIADRTSIDLRTICRAGIKQSLWNEFEVLKKKEIWRSTRVLSLTSQTQNKPLMFLLNFWRESLSNFLGPWVSF